MAHSTKRPASFVDPDRLYALRGFQEASGIAASRMREARLVGIHLATIRVGRRIFVRGVDGIAYIEKLAQLSSS